MTELKIDHTKVCACGLIHHSTAAIRACSMAAVGDGKTPDVDAWIRAMRLISTLEEGLEVDVDDPVGTAEEIKLLVETGRARLQKEIDNLRKALLREKARSESLVVELTLAEGHRVKLDELKEAIRGEHTATCSSRKTVIKCSSCGEERQFPEWIT